MSKIALLIKEIRSTGLSQTDIERETGIPQPRVSRWEGGEVAASADDALKLLALARRLGIKTVDTIKSSLAGA